MTNHEAPTPTKFFVTVALEVEADSPEWAAQFAYNQLSTAGGVNQATTAMRVWAPAIESANQIGHASTRWTYDSKPTEIVTPPAIIANAHVVSADA